MSVKQDRTYTRTAAELERKLNTNKRFAEVLGLIDDTRDKVDSVESSLRSEITDMSTSIKRDTEKIVFEATKTTVTKDEFEDYKKTNVILHIDSSAGNLFKNSNIATILTVTVINGDKTITDSTRLKEVFGDYAKLKWQHMRMGEIEFTDLDENDPRLSDNGFIFTVHPNDIFTKTVFNCILEF